MILWTIKLLSSVRKAIAGRRYPSQLAWGVAFGLLLGLIPHGNLLAIALVILVMTLRLNHAMAGLVAVCVTLVAPRMDDTFHQMGEWMFAQPNVSEKMASAWQLPLIPWTDLNNTVVMGSFMIGLLVLVPTFLLTYPVFRYWSLGVAIDEDLADEAPQQRSREEVRQREQRANAQSRSTEQANSTPEVAAIDAAHSSVPAPHSPRTSPTPVHRPASDSQHSDESRHVATTGRVYDVRRVDAPETNSKAPTQVRIVSSRPTEATQTKPATATAAPAPAASGPDMRQASADDQHKIDEALSYLLRQLRDSQEKDAA